MLVNGRVVVKESRVTSVDVASVVAEVRGMLSSIRGRNRDLHDAVKTLI